MTKRSKKQSVIGLVVLLFIFYYFICYAETIVFEGTPEMTSTSSPEGSFNLKVEGEDKGNYTLIITKEGDDYIWFSRDKKKLNHSKSGAFDYFVEPNGAGYIKITKLEDGRYMYMESMNMFFKIITYWGTGDKFEP